MTHKPNKREKDEINAGADALLYPGGGGIAIWVRRDELQPRAAIRFRTENPSGEALSPEYVVTVCAALRIGLERVMHALADEHGMDRKRFAEMVEVGFNVLMPKYETASEIRR